MMFRPQHIEKCLSLRLLSVIALALLLASPVQAQTPPSITSGLVLYGPDDSVATPITIPSTGVTVTGTTSVAGVYSNALHFNGTSDGVTVAKMPLSSFSAFTVAAWVNPDKLDTGRSAVFTYEIPDGTKRSGHNTTVTAYALVFGVDASRGATPHAPMGLMEISGATKLTGGNVVLPAKKWSHLAMTYDGTTMTFYVNGVKAGSTKVGTLPYTAAGKIVIGGTDTDSNQNFTGSIDEVRLYNRVLTSSELTTLGTPPVTNAALNVSESGTPASGTAPLAVNFTASANGGSSPYTYSWAFGDSQSSTTQNPSHTYAASGTYSAKVTVTDSAHNTASAGQTITVNPATALSASASANPTSGNAPLTVAFTGGAAGGTSPYTYSWNFGDGSTASTSQSPSHTYTSAGSYTATLTVNDSASHTATKTVSITASATIAALTATASGSPTSGNAPLAVAFTGSATGGVSPYSYSWNFGDGSTASTVQNPSHTYTTTGNYTAILTVSDSASHTGAASTSVSASSDSSTVTYDGLTIPQAHPRLWWTPARLAQATAYFASHPYTPSSSDPSGECLAYLVTGNTAYAQDPINQLMSFTISASELAGVSSDNYRWADWVPVVFDWCYNAMTPDQVSTFMTRYTGYVTTMMGKSWGGVGMDENNYFWGYWRNEFNWGVATYYEQTPQAQPILDFALNSRWADFVKLASAGAGGGVPGEGTQYGRYMLEYPIIPLVTAANMGRNLLAETPFFQQAATGYLPYATSPGPIYSSNTNSSFPQLFPFDDDEMSYGFPPAKDVYYNEFMGMMAEQSTGAAAGTIRQWLATDGSTTYWYIEAVDNGGTSQPFAGLPLDYYASGPSYLYVKNSWLPSASSLAFILGYPAEVGHLHLDAGSFQINRNGYWLSREAVGYSDSITGPGGVGSVGTDSTWTVNGLIIDNMQLAGSYVEGPPVVTRLDSQPNYVFTSVNLSAAYRAPTSSYTNPDGTPRDDNPSVASAVRDYIYVRPLETLVAFDRIATQDPSTVGWPTLAASPASIRKTFLLHFPNNPTIQDSTHVLGVNGTQALRLTMLVPAAQSVPSSVVVNEAMSGQAGDTSPQFRLEESHSGEAQSYLINVIQARDATAPDVTATMTENATSFTITLTHPINGTAVIQFAKGMTSTGGSFGYAASGMPTTLTPLATSVNLTMH